MSEELKRGIPKAIPTGEKVIYTEEEKEQHERDFERILKEAGVMQEYETLADWRKQE